MLQILQKLSPILSRDKSEMLLGLLGSESQVVTTAIIQLFLTDLPRSVTRRKHECGVLCLIKDSQRHSYFFQVYCIFRKQKVWEHEVDKNLEYLSPKPFLHTFEAGDAIVIFKFSSKDEACQMRIAVMEMLESQRRGQQRSQPHGIAKHSNTDVSSEVPTGDSHLYNGVVPAITQNSHSTVTSGGQKEKESKRKITKADIGFPQNFRHVSHVGWDPIKGFDMDNVENPQLKQLFDKAGVSDSQLQDRETREFIYDFINRHGGLDAVKNESALPSAPPAPPPVPVSALTTPTNNPARCPPPPPPPSPRPRKPPRPPSRPGGLHHPPPSLEEEDVVAV